MDSVNAGLEKQRAKRKRVARMKRFIITVIVLFMLFTLLMMGFLTIKIFSLEREIEQLSTQIAESKEVEQEATTSDENLLDNLYIVDNQDNLAQEGDAYMVYLTFEDGPSDNTDAILDILDEYNVKATFFVVGKDLDTYSEQYKRIVDEGHTIGMHSYSHNYSDIYSSENAFIEDFEKIRDLIQDTTGVTPQYYRFPGGSSNKMSNISMSVFINYLDEQGVVYYDWNAQAGDATSQAFTSDELVDNVMTDVVKYKTSVVLLHDGNSKNSTVEALPKLIESLQAMDATILPISDDTTVIQHVSVVK